MSASKVYQILWADDEIDLLKPHILFLQTKGYEVTPVRSGNEAIDAVQAQHFDLIFLDEHMPGLTGLDTLQRIKELRPFLPIVMVTKSEEEELMNQAIGGKITDYLIKNSIVPTLYCAADDIAGALSAEADRPAQP